MFRKLDQNVKAFRLAEKKLADKMQISVDYAGAQMVGRYRNGTPLIPISPPQPTSAGKMNDFNFSSDRTTGSKCPFGSHIRKTNQRGSGKPDGVQFPRRGITYGGNLSTDAESGVGLLFMASIVTLVVSLSSCNPLGLTTPIFLEERMDQMA